MCRNITTLRGLEPVATAEEIEAGARQYVRKISGVQQASAATEASFERAVAEITPSPPDSSPNSPRGSHPRNKTHPSAAWASN